RRWTTSRRWRSRAWHRHRRVGHWCGRSRQFLCLEQLLCSGQTAGMWAKQWNAARQRADRCPLFANRDHPSTTITAAYDRADTAPYSARPPNCAYPETVYTPACEPAEGERVATPSERLLR